MAQEKSNEQVVELLLQSLEHEKGGVLVYQTALKCAQNADLREEWEKYLEETRHHVEVLEGFCAELGLDTTVQTPGCKIVKHLGRALVDAMEMALQASPAAAQLVACECVVNAETKDHLNWQLLGECAEKLFKGDAARSLKKSYEEVEDQEDEHLYHSKGWCRELWLESLGMPAVLPPPEEEKQVKTAIGASRAEQARRSN